MELVARDNLKLAIAAILVACFSLSLGDALIKQQSASFVIWQIFVMRSVIAIPFLIYFVRIASLRSTSQADTARMDPLAQLDPGVCALLCQREDPDPQQMPVRKSDRTLAMVKHQTRNAFTSVTPTNPGKTAPTLVPPKRL